MSCIQVYCHRSPFAFLLAFGKISISAKWAGHGQA